MQNEDKVAEKCCCVLYLLCQCDGLDRHYSQGQSVCGNPQDAFACRHRPTDSRVKAPKVDISTIPLLGTGLTNSYSAASEGTNLQDATSQQATGVPVLTP